MTKEQKFYNALKDLFVGAKVEGESGYINLMRIKSRYFEKGVFPKLHEDINNALEPFPEFREELFDKLYTFFSRYFSESGSIYFRYTPSYQNVYEKVYTDDRDVILFWKTHMLYYVKTDRLFKSLEVDIDGYKFYFDVSSLEYKKANEKRDIIYEFKEKRQDGTLVFNVLYSERGKTTKVDEILKSLKREKVEIGEDILERAFRVFEKQSEVDYFINKNAREFLREQFEIWLYQYIFKGESEWTEKRIKQLQVLKDIAFKIIDFISQFEDELVKIWNKPKFVLNSNYVITLDRIAERDKELKLMEKILNHANFIEQEKEWKELGIVDDSFKVEDIIKDSPFLKGWHSEGMTGYLKLPYNPNLKEKARELRKAGNLSEVLLWNHLKQKKMLGFDFTRQQVIGDYIVDFYCPKLRLVIEIDGESHDFKGEYDEARDKYLQSLGLTVLHFKDKDIKHSLNEVLMQIESWIKNSPFYKRSTREAGEVLNTPSANADTPLQKGNTPSASQTPLLEKGELNPKYKHLPIDTKYFKDLEPEILGLFDDLDNSLDGWLIKSENYQALNTILPKFKEKVQTIYIDPPFNKEQDADYFYSVKYKDATWITMLENRLRLARDVLKDTGSIFVRCDYNGNMYVRLLMNEIFGEENFRNEIIINRKRESIGTPNKFEVESEFLFLYSKTEKAVRKNIYKERSLVDFKWTGFLKQEERKPSERIFMGKILYPPKGQHFPLSQEKVDKLIKEHYLRLRCKECGAIYYWDDEERKEKFVEAILSSGKEKFKYYDIKPTDIVYGVIKIDKCLNCKKDNWKVEYLTSAESKITDNWKDIPSYEDTFRFKTENSEILLKRVIESTSNEGDLVMDFFLGSGTTTAVAHKLKRKWIGIEMGEHFYSVVLPRMKKVLAYDKSGISKEKDVKEKYNENNAGGFFKYYELEQYEDTLRRVKYDDSDLFDNPYQDPYNQYVFMKDLKMLSALEIEDYENNKVKVDLSKLYQNIDVPETLSNLLGKWIKRITPDYVEFENGERIDLKNLDYKLIKPLIWW